MAPSTMWRWATSTLARTVGSTGRIWYSGSPEVTNYDHIEPDPGHVLVVDVDETDPSLAGAGGAVQGGRWRFVTLRRSVDSSRDVADLDINLDLMPDKERTVVQLALTGSLTVTDKAALDACLDKYARLFAALGTWDSGRPTSPSFPPTASSTTSASAASRPPPSTSWWPRRASDGDEADDARAALALLLRLAGRGSVA